MKQKSLTISLLVCAVLAAALLLSVVALISAKSEISALEDQVHALSAQLDAASNQTVSVNAIPEGDYCTLIIEKWSAENGILTVDALAQAALPANTNAQARIELWDKTDILSSQPFTLDARKELGIYEAETTVQFELPKMDEGDELQLWLIVEPEGGLDIFSCGAGFYLEDGQVMIIAG